MNAHVFGARDDEIDTIAENEERWWRRRQKRWATKRTRTLCRPRGFDSDELRCVGRRVF